MASPKISPQDRKDLDKFSKYLVYKCAQIIIQSRSGEKISTQSKLVSSGTDWFNLSIRDDPDILAEIRNIYGSSNLLDGQKVCFEISAKTAEGEETALETWYLEMTDYCDPSSRVSCSVYSRMGVLLRSLLIVTRAVPAYRVSREQGSDRYVMCYRIYLGMPKFDNLGENYVKRTVGLVPSPVGTIALYIAYRAKKNLSLRHHLADVLAKDFRDNYYRPESVPKSNSDLSCTRHEYAFGGQIAEDRKMDTRSQSATDLTATAESHRDDTHGKGSMDQFHNHSKGTAFKKDQPIKPGSLVPDQDFASNPCNSHSPNTHFEAEDFCRHKTESDLDGSGGNAFPLETTDGRGAAMKQSLQPMVVVSGSSASDHSSPSATSAPDDFVVLHTKAPFTEVGLDEEELGKFYQECKVAPPLSMFQQSTDLQEMLNSITDQLAQFEANARDFDEFVNSITEDAN